MPEPWSSVARESTSGTAGTANVTLYPLSTIFPARKSICFSHPPEVVELSEYRTEGRASVMELMGVNVFIIIVIGRVRRLLY
jgi:hypothetical protein